MNRFSTTLSALLVGLALCTACGGSGGGKPAGGIHAKLGYSDGGGLRVFQVPPGGAADLAGLQVDDVIIAIDGTSVRELDYETIVERLRGPAGSTVKLDVFRDAEVDTIVVTRQAYTR